MLTARRIFMVHCITLAIATACTGSARDVASAAAVAASDSILVPSGFRIAGVTSYGEGMLLWGHNSDSLLLWEMNAGVFKAVTGLGGGVVGAAENTSGTLEILDTLTARRSSRTIKVGNMIANVTMSMVKPLESVAYGASGWRAIAVNADSSFSFLDPTAVGGLLMRYRSPEGPIRPRIDRAILASMGDDYVVVLRFFPYTLIRLNASGVVLDSMRPAIPEQDTTRKTDNTQLVVLRIMGTWDEPRIVLTDPFSLRRVLASRRGILMENNDATLPIFESSQGWYAEIRAGSPVVLRRRSGKLRQALQHFQEGDTP